MSKRVRAPGVDRRPRGVRARVLGLAQCAGFALAFGVVGQADGQLATWTVSAEPLLAIGKSGDPDYEFHRIIGVVRGSNGGVVVADRGHLTIRYYDATGLLEKEVGGRGRGPGEFSYIGGLWRAPDGTLGVWDARNRRLTYFDDHGSLLRTGRVEDVPGNLEVFFGTYLDGDVLLASLMSRPPEPAERPDTWVMSRFSHEGGFVAHVGHVRGMWRFGRNPVPFSPIPRVTVVNDRILTSDGYGAEVAVRDPSGITIGALSVDVYDEDAHDIDELGTSLEATLEARSSFEADAIRLEHLRSRRVPRPARFPRVAGVLADDSGAIWVRRYSPASDALWLNPDAVIRPPRGGRWDIFDQRSGLGVASVQMPAGFVPFAISENRLLGVLIDDLGVETVATFRLFRSDTRAGEN